MTRFSYGSVRSAATKPSRVRATPSGPTYSCVSHQYDGSALLDEHPVLAPAREVAGGLLLRVGQGQAHDVVRAALLVLLALLAGDDVVRRRDEPGERPGDRLVEAERAKRADRGHAPDRTSGPDPG